jgi:hypothetical protein
MERLGTVATGKAVVVAPIPPHENRLQIALQHADLRTIEVGARAGEAIGSAAVAAGMSEVSASTSVASASASVVNVVAERARVEGERVILTEVSTALGLGSQAAMQIVSDDHPNLRMVWDATLDRRVCATCAGLHHVVVDVDEAFPGGFDDAPAHPRCRCYVMPWLDSWTDLLEERGIGPGPRTGVAGEVEQQLGSFRDVL